MEEVSVFSSCPSAVVGCSGWIPKKRKDSRKIVLKADRDIAETTLLASAWTAGMVREGCVFALIPCRFLLTQ